MVEKTEHKLRIGLIGFGAMGRGTAKALTHDDNWDLVAIADVAGLRVNGLLRFILTRHLCRS